MNQEIKIKTNFQESINSENISIKKEDDFSNSDEIRYGNSVLEVKNLS